MSSTSIRSNGYTKRPRVRLTTRLRKPLRQRISIKDLCKMRRHVPLLPWIGPLHNSFYGGLQGHCDPLKENIMTLQKLLKSRLALMLLAGFAYLTWKAVAQHFGLADSAGTLGADALGLGTSGIALGWALGHCDTLDGPVVT